jgi:cell wall-associated NlpC family hydrolase
MRRNLLVGTAVAAVAISIPVTAVISPAFSGTARAATLSSQQKAAPATKATTTARVTWNMVAAALARELVGAPYAYGGTSTAGFDCSGLTQWVYHHAGGGKAIDRIANDQFHEFKRISQAAARPGDLVFFHETSDPSSYVYHVGVYEGGNDIVAATTPSGGVRFESFAWAGNTVTFGTVTH